MLFKLEWKIRVVFACDGSIVHKIPFGPQEMEPNTFPADKTTPLPSLEDNNH